MSDSATTTEEMIPVPASTLREIAARIHAVCDEIEETADTQAGRGVAS
jgi:hypothetical protein